MTGQWEASQRSDGSSWVFSGDRLVVRCDNLGVARRVAEVHNEEIAALAARTDRAELEALIERVVFALNLGGEGTLDEADKVERDHGNQLANLYLDLCAALGRGHRAAAPTAERRPADGERGA